MMPAAGHAQVSNALAEQRASKKRAADDVKLLANRIALLKLEEKKVSLPFHVRYFHRLLALICTIGMEKNRGDEEEGRGCHESPHEEPEDANGQRTVTTIALG